MKLYEKILVVTVVALFGSQLFDYSNKGLIFGLTTWILSLSYLFGGYWLFNSSENRKCFLPIAAGVAFSTSLFTLPITIRLHKDIIYNIVPAVNGILFLSLTIYIAVFRKSDRITSDIKSIFIRTVIILAITSFFTYTPATFKPYRKVLIALNNGDNYLKNNLLMFEYTAECNDALENGDCDKAIYYGLKANKAGKLWLGINNGEISDLLKGKNITSVELLEDVRNAIGTYANQEDLYKISGTYTNLYKAYNCKANREYDNSHYSDALKHYEIAYAILTSCDQHSNYWDVEKSWALNHIALCNRELKKYAIADSIFAKAITNYKIVKTVPDNGLAQLYRNFALSLSDESQYYYSNVLFYGAISILRKDTVNVDNRRDLVKNYNGLVKNYILQDSLNEAVFFIKRATRFSNEKEEESSCLTKLYYGLLLYNFNEYKKSDSVIKNCLQCYKKLPKDNSQNIAECYKLLSWINLSLDKYDEARKYLNAGIQITIKEYGSSSSQYADYLKVEALLNKIVGDYKTSEQQYNQAIYIYQRQFGKRTKRLPHVLSGLSDLEITLSKLDQAKHHSDTALSIASSFGQISYPSFSDLINNSAYVNYCFGLLDQAKKLYKDVISINVRYGRNNDAATAIALNGLGLIEVAKHNFPKADSLFSKSLELHKRIFSDNSPHIATVYFNIGSLYIQQGKLIDAEEKLNKSLTIDRQFFKTDHDIFADIFVELGNLAKKKGQNVMAKNYYQKALNIYTAKFDSGHLKVVATKRKLKNLK